MSGLRKVIEDDLIDWADAPDIQDAVYEDEPERTPEQIAETRRIWKEAPHGYTMCRTCGYERPIGVECGLPCV